LDKPSSTKEIIPIKQIDKIYLQKTFGKESNFLTFLKNKFPEDVVEQVILDYFLSGTQDKGIFIGKLTFTAEYSQGKLCNIIQKQGIGLRVFLSTN
jgi:hypothetical protein